MAEVVDGRKLAADLEGELRERLAAICGPTGARPGLVTIRVGDDPASIVYLRNKHRACARVGIASRAVELPEHTSEAELLARIDELNRDASVHGILVQLPVPRAIDPSRIARAVLPTKDVDGLHPENAGDLMAGRPALYPCTPVGCIEILRRHGVRLEGARAVVIGRSNIVGRPLALLLEHQNATVTLCHSRTRDLADAVRGAEIVVAAAGQPHLVQGDWIAPGAAVIDVGIHRLPDGKLIGDVDFATAAPRAGLITPVPGGVGPLTIAMLLANTTAAFERAREAR
jgi:methylenetetrahydrofolate dehydrogenase (NADP+) / methenyltetrahydrofolate cyclohydrolase